MTELPRSLDVGDVRPFDPRDLAVVAPAPTTSAAARKITPVIICGGSGSRMWPESRETLPKQFIPLIGRLSTFQMAVEGLADALFHRPIVISHYDYRFLVADQLEQVGVSATIVLEPARRGSAAAAVVAAEIAARADPQAIVALLSSDHVIEDRSRFAEMCRVAAETAAQGYIVGLGASRSVPADGRPYLRAGARIAPASDVRRVVELADRPVGDDPEEFAASGWSQNFGDFVFRCDTLQAEIERLQPTIASAAKAALANATSDLGFSLLDANAFSRAPSMSLHRAAMGNSDRAAVLAGDFRCTDIGSWRALGDLAQRDEDGNSLTGEAVVLNARNVFVRSSERLTAVVGVENVIVVTTEDAVLVLNRNHDGEVKDLVERLKRENRREAVEHRRIFRPWGHYQSVDVGARYQVKRIVVKPGARLSLQKHFHRAEHWIVVKGTAEVTRSDEVRLVHENESIYMPIGCVHRLGNPGKIDLELIEVQTGSYLGEDDIVRFEDVYNRA